MTRKPNRKTYSPFESVVLLKHTLSQQNLRVADVLRILNISRKQLYYWDEQGLTFSVTRSKPRSWRKFSKLDLLGFLVLKELFNIGLNLRKCKGVFEWLYSYIQGSVSLMYDIADGTTVLLSTDSEFDRFFTYCVTEEEMGEDGITRMERPSVVIPLSAMFRFILRQTASDDFYVKFREDKYGNKNRILFYINGRPLNLEDSRQIVVELLQK